MYFVCPECNTPHSSTFDHIKTGGTFGPWYCDTCGSSVFGRVTKDGVELARGNDKKAKTLVLLRLNIETDKPVHVIVKGMLFYGYDETPGSKLQDQQSHDEYFYNEHTCPWNWIRKPIKVGDDCDPHGVFVHQETILMPEEFEDGNIHDIETWADLFPSIRSNMHAIDIAMQAASC